jgi:RNA polymerase-interacting CarD/CdnL/TRCF family regulator
MCDVWVWQDVITRFAEEVFAINEMNEEQLEAKILEVASSSNNN